MNQQMKACTFTLANEKLHLPKNFHVNSQGSFIYGHQSSESAQMYFNRWMIKYRSVDIYHGVLLRNKKE